jgi:signal transduction histidine kinase
VEDKLNKHLPKSNLSKLKNDLSSHEVLQPRFLEVRDSQGGIVFQGNRMRQLAGLEAGPVPAFKAVQTDAGPWRVLTVRRRIHDVDYAIQIAAELQVPLDILRWFGLMMLLSSPAVLAFASIVGYWVGARALSPVTEIARAARSIGAADLSQRVTAPSSGDELQYLAETVNGMLSRIEDAFRHMSQFTANASHELRTPVAVIRTAAEVALLRTPEDIDIYREALYKILDEAKKNALLLDDMLSLAKADAGTAVLRIETVDVGQNILQACECVGLLAQEKGVRLTVSVGDRPVYIAADPRHLRRLWLILLENAIKYTPSGRWIEVRLTQPTSCYAACEVEDAGIGNSSSDLPHVFERFYRADKARDRAEGGAGLGLSIAKWIAGVHDARIKVESVLGRGSTFQVIFSQSASSSASLPPAAPSDTPAQVTM